MAKRHGAERAKVYLVLPEAGDARSRRSPIPKLPYNKDLDKLKAVEFDLYNIFRGLADASVDLEDADVENSELDSVRAAMLSALEQHVDDELRAIYRGLSEAVIALSESETDELAPESIDDLRSVLRNSVSRYLSLVPSRKAKLDQEQLLRERRDKVVLEFLPLVQAIAVRVQENLPVHVELDDLVHAGVLGLFDAATKFNPEKQVAFSAYAKHRIKGAILDSLRQLDWASRDMRRRHKQVEAATRELAATLQRHPSEAEVAQKLGMDLERMRTMMLELRDVGLVSTATRGGESEDLPDSVCAKEQLRSVLGIAMKTLPERYQKVVMLYYTNEMTMKEIGTILGIDESRVSQIHKSALEKMNAALEGAGFTSAQAF